MTISLDAALTAFAKGHTVPPQLFCVLRKKGFIAKRGPRSCVSEAGLRRLGFKGEPAASDQGRSPGRAGR